MLNKIEFKFSNYILIESFSKLEIYTIIYAFLLDVMKSIVIKSDIVQRIQTILWIDTMFNI